LGHRLAGACLPLSATIFSVSEFRFRWIVSQLSRPSLPSGCWRRTLSLFISTSAMYARRYAGSFSAYDGPPGDAAVPISSCRLLMAIRAFSALAAAVEQTALSLLYHYRHSRRGFCLPPAYRFCLRLYYYRSSCHLCPMYERLFPTIFPLRAPPCVATAICFCLYACLRRPHVAWHLFSTASLYLLLTTSLHLFSVFLTHCLRPPAHSVYMVLFSRLPLPITSYIPLFLSPSLCLLPAVTLRTYHRKVLAIPPATLLLATEAWLWRKRLLRTGSRSRSRHIIAVAAARGRLCSSSALYIYHRLHYRRRGIDNIHASSPPTIFLPV